MFSRARVVSGFLLVILLIVAYAILDQTGFFSFVTDGEKLQSFFADAGWWGPFCIIGLMAVAIVMSPVPSAPIALASGLVYGHFLGTVFVVIGAEIGAIIAFGIARLAGYEFLKKWFGEKLETVRILGSQNSMMAIVFISRLLPFVSFDIVSYVAGLTPLSFWRFALATLAGIIPMSFLLAHFGQEIGTGDPRTIILTALALGMLTLLPIAGRIIYRKYNKGS